MRISDWSSDVCSSDLHEWWHGIEARPGAYIDLGLKAAISPERLAAAAQDGSLPELMNRTAPATGSSFYLKDATIHSLSPRLTVLEIQEPTAATNHLLDSGRPPQRHLSQGVGHGCPHTPPPA